MNNKHWTQLLNANPRLLKLDVHVVTERIQVNASAPWNPKTNVWAAHAYYAANQEDQVKKVMCSMYNKKQRWMNMQTSLPEGNIFRYFPYNMKYKIALTPRRTAQFLKSKVVQYYPLARHHAITVWSVSGCDRIITVPNGTAITLNQAIMGVKT